MAYFLGPDLSFSVRDGEICGVSITSSNFDPSNLRKMNDDLYEGLVSQTIDLWKNPLIDVKFRMIGTEFQKSVWKRVRQIPWGSTITYKELAESLDNSKAYRAVASACASNDLALIVPCHRVVGIKSIGGFKWGNASLKERLIDFEKNNV